MLKNKKGITLISLIITIIIILILAGVGIAGSLSLIEQAKYTAFINEIKQVNEAITILIAEKQLEVAGTDEKIQPFEEKLKVEKKQIEELPISLQNEIKYIRALLAATNKAEVTEKLPSEYSQDTIEEGSIYYVDSEHAGGKNQAYIYDEQSASAYKIEPTIIWGVKIHGYEYGNLLVSQPGLLEKAQEKQDDNLLEKINKAIEIEVSTGNDVILENKEYKITQSTKVEDFSIIVPENITAKLYMTEQIEIDNREYKKSGIDIKETACLEIYIYDKVEILSGKGNKPAAATGSANGVSGESAYAGIHVPEGATLKIFGDNELYAYGGDAGDGGDTSQTINSYESSGGSGGGAGAGIGGNGGKGGQPYGKGSGTYRQSIAPENGENAGNVYITGKVKVYAYGGGGGSAGNTLYGNDSSGSGGYPAAGIGGGGAGGGGSAGSGGDAGGGFSGAASQSSVATYGGTNGLAGEAKTYPAGAGYFEASKGTSWTGYVRGGVGGGAGYYATWYGSTDGATGGKGGNVYIEDMNNVYAYNGSYITTSDSGTTENPWGKYQCPIYAQLGIKLDAVRTGNVYIINGRTGNDVITELSSYNNTIETIEYTNSTPITVGNENLGIGSGAGYIEDSNGTLNI